MTAKSPAWNSTWPRLKIYDGDHLRRVALPLGGIGTGTVSLGGNGTLRNWEVMTGFEYVVAAQLIQEGRSEEGLECIRDIRGRFDGRKRNPFDEAECGHHYARAMAAWAAVPALAGFNYSGVTKTMTFAARSGCHFWSNGYAWGQCRIVIHRGTAQISLSVLKGRITLKRLELTGLGSIVSRRDCVIREGQTRHFKHAP